MKKLLLPLLSLLFISSAQAQVIKLKSDSTVKSVAPNDPSKKQVSGSGEIKPSNINITQAQVIKDTVDYNKIPGTVVRRHNVGEIWGGGTVFYVDTAGQHGLVAAGTDLPGRLNWQQAKNECDGLSSNGFSDWRLPTKEELNIMYQNKNLIGGFVYAQFGGVYWSSSEFATGKPWSQSFFNGSPGFRSNETTTFFVRAVRSF